MTVQSPFSGQAITLANSIIGVGILAMPFCFKQCGIILSIFILLGSGVLSRLACHFLLKSAIYSRRDNFESLAYYVFGSAGKFAAEIGIIGFLMGTCVAYFVVVGDLGPQIIAKMFNLNQSDFLRTSVMVIVSLVCVLPLGLLRNVDSLSNVCAATIGFYFCLVLKILAEASNPLVSGEWMSKVEYWRPDGVLQCLPIFSMALCCQTQLFEIYDSLPNATLDKMNSVTKNAVNICTAVYILVGLFGYIAFCHLPISGNILVNFSPTMGSDVIQIGFVMSLAFSFPLIIFPCRASLYSLLYRKGQSHSQELINNLIPKVRFKCLTVCIILVTLLIGVMLPNIELVLGLVGSTIGIMICVIFPSTCFICVSVKNTNERILAQIALCFGIIIMVLGTYANLQAVEMDKIGLETKIAIEMDKYSSNDNKISQMKSPREIENELRRNIMGGEEINYKELKDEKKVSSESSKSPDPKVPAIVSDSKAQPPNPIPPAEESVNQPIPTMEAIKAESSVKDEKIEGAGDKEVNVQLEDIILSTNTEQTVEKDKEIEEKNTKKEAALMQTIKKHAEDQRKMVEEQKEILEEIKEMKKDIESKQKEETRTKITNKKAVENIKKLAQAAIESLQDVSSKRTEAPAVKEAIKEIEKVVNENINDKPSKEAHVHKPDEPESYKMGEDTKNTKKINKTAEVGFIVSQKAMSEGIPLAIALSKPNKVENKKQENEVLKDTIIEDAVKKESSLDAKVASDKVENIVEKIETKVKEESPPVAEGKKSDYTGGKRDILQLHTESTLSPNNHEEMSSRVKRSVSDVENKESCTKSKLSNSDVLNLSKVNVADSNSLLYNQLKSNSLEFRARSLKSTKVKR